VRVLAAPTVQPLESLSPSAFEVMRACRLRSAFGRSGQLGPARPTVAQLLGTISHAVLEALATTRAILGDRWDEELESQWTHATQAAAAELAAHDSQTLARPEEWDGYQIKLARLRKTARRLHELLAPLGADAELITEQPLANRDGRLQGRPDLIVRAGGALWLVDYKTGAVISRDTREPRESYVRQLRLYAYLAAESLGQWPQRALLVPLQGPVVDVEIDPDACANHADEALEQLAVFNAHAPDSPPASPAPETCQWCPYAAVCPAFWSHCDEQWASVILAAAGPARAVLHPSLGGVSLTIDAHAGSLEPRIINVRAISPDDHPAVATAEAGSDVALVGLRPDRDTTGFVLPEYGRAAVWPP
jgi:RecB family exonuclease